MKATFTLDGAETVIVITTPKDGGQRQRHELAPGATVEIDTSDLVNFYIVAAPSTVP